MSSEPDYHDDLGPSIEATGQIVNHLQKIREILDGPACWAFGANEETRRQMESLNSARLHFEDFLRYLETDIENKPDLDHETKTTMVMEAVRQNLNDSDFVNWLFEELGMGMSQ